MITGAPAWRLRRYAHLPSTQTLAVTLAEADEPEGLAILADRQSAGQGTQGRVWEGASGNLHISMLLRPRGPMAEVAQYALLAGIALAEAVAGFAPDPAALSLKWPNDLLLGGAKMAGILTQAAARPEGGIDWVIFGIGVNLVAAPPVPGRSTACLGRAVPVEALAAALLARIDHWRLVRSVEGFAPIRAAWLARGPQRGTWLNLSRPDISGRFEGLGEDGSLLLGTAGRIHALRAGEIRD
ncbi:BirA family biotin operon repressor/biotin-[acetyl-CoA-carboxylase] ligase [Humitalea rosea]|uniref:BirA family biotin operon repressor/biotin-[acetyl-CoA-carboxylase] ligase n=1 Tax=Humitalea rosea TaxID=990373 RepID=A0A2W7I9L7_9PROT|nr:biotin--[acetyl-CoA-carboxylase] ligase [Humitalea rosea]PZW43596.1 BirA family biotin operon repressor/biotin-[acetyl-CoA-carboxylase] ligase [Humitalea rosea]